ncbi:uncharacterized protein LOC34624115 [Cyclospora cayetanensis]|uniref:Uncharacterized protein LOC34624115 n=1 Tax=Cyclospora cayetanensis TaxID=88456 RepID=A0A6P6S034_9EIME|nr:uncharacterized protein LOC34624115 [Cyclospora cayetanensis]
MCLLYKATPGDRSRAARESLSLKPPAKALARGRIRPQGSRQGLPGAPVVGWWGREAAAAISVNTQSERMETTPLPLGRRAQLLRLRPLYQRVDVLPFAATAFALLVLALREHEALGSQDAAEAPTTGAAHADVPGGPAASRSEAAPVQTGDADTSPSSDLAANFQRCDPAAAAATACTGGAGTGVATHVFVAAGAEEKDDFLVPIELLQLQQAALATKGTACTAGPPKTGRVGGLLAPADALLLQGTAVVDESLLTGEAIPQAKAGLSLTAADPEALNEALELQGRHKQFAVFAGTSLLAAENESDRGLGCCRPPSNSPVCVAVRTGFATTEWLQPDVEHLQQLRAENKRSPNTWRLLLTLSHIVTSVVPPEFPMLLSLTLSVGVLHLARVGICCTDTLKLAAAGGVRVTAFDKTGTLTHHSYKLLGVFGVGRNPEDLDSQTPRQRQASILSQQSPLLTALAVGSCHCLKPDSRGVPVGDPLELAAFKSFGWQFTSQKAAAIPSPARGDCCCNRWRETVLLGEVDLPSSTCAMLSCCVCFAMHAAAGGKKGESAARLSLLFCFPFASSLQRTTSVAEFRVSSERWRACRQQQQPQQHQQQEEELHELLHRKQQGYIVAVKGAPERLKGFLAKVPAFYDAMADALTSRVCRAAAAASAAGAAAAAAAAPASDVCTSAAAVHACCARFRDCASS